MQNSTGSHKRMAAEELTQMLETPLLSFKSLKLDHPTLVTRLEALIPFIESFTNGAGDLSEMGRAEEARLVVGALVRHLAASLDISIEDSQSFCVCILMMRTMMKSMCSFFESLAEKKAWEEWFQELWQKEK